jgi:hypothetical protein
MSDNDERIRDLYQEMSELDVEVDEAKRALTEQLIRLITFRNPHIEDEELPGVSSMISDVVNVLANYSSLCIKSSQMRDDIFIAENEIKERTKDVDNADIKGMIIQLETGDSAGKAYAFDALKDFVVSQPSRQKINQTNLGAYLRTVFSDRDHSEPKYVSEIVNELFKENCKYIDDVEALIGRYPVDNYVDPLDVESGIRSTDVGVIRSLLVARKIDEINEAINGWEPPLSELPDLLDGIPFVNVGGGIASYLMKSGNSIKIHTTNAGDLEITNNELGNRIGTGLPYLRRLMARLNPFHTYLVSKAEM